MVLYEKKRLARLGKKHSPETIEKIRQSKLGTKNPNYGKHFTVSEELKQKRRENMLGIKNPNYGKYGELNPAFGSKSSTWKGDDVSYKVLHSWVRKYLPKPELCEYCKEKPSYDLANITGVYKRGFENWKYLCRRCHMLSDGRMEKFHSRENYEKISKKMMGNTNGKKK